MRNHSVQYSCEPDHGWLNLRRQWPWVYEAWADLKMETWTKIKIEVKGRSAKLRKRIGAAQPGRGRAERRGFERRHCAVELPRPRSLLLEFPHREFASSPRGAGDMRRAFVGPIRAPV